MVRGKIILAPLICLLITILPSQSLSRMQRPPRRLPARRPPRMSRADRLKRIEQAKEQAREQALCEALEATKRQWRVILPPLRKVRELREQAKISVGINNAAWVTTTETTRTRRQGGAGGYGGTSVPGRPGAAGMTSGGPATQTTRHYENWRWKKAWEGKTKLTKQEKACEELIGLLESDSSTDEQKRQKMNALRQAREEARGELAKAQQELRQVLTLRQEAMMVMMGWLN